MQAQLERWPDEVERWADAGPLVTVQRGAGALKKLAQAGHPVRRLELRLGPVGERAVPGSSHAPAPSTRAWARA